MACPLRPSVCETFGALDGCKEPAVAWERMFTPQPIAYIRSPFTETSSIPKGLGAKHDTEGVIEVLREFEPGLKDIEGFSHLFVLWVFDRADGVSLVATPPADERLPHGVFATRSPRRPNPIGLTVVESCSGAMGYRSAFAAWTCLTGHRCWISSHICRVCRWNNCGGDGWRRRKRGKAVISDRDRRRACYGMPSSLCVCRLNRQRGCSMQ